MTAKKNSYNGTTVTLTDPLPTDATPPKAVNANQNPFPVSGTNGAPNAVDGSLTDETTNNIYFPVSGGALGAGGAWTLNFDCGNALNGDDILYVYAYDTVTGDPAQATYTQQAFFEESKPAKSKASSRAARQIAPPKVEVLECFAAKGVQEQDIPERLQDIPVKVTHAEYKRGLVLLILRKNGPAPATIVKVHRLEPSPQTTCTFRGVKMDKWDLVCVNAIVEGGHAGKPVVLKKP